MCATTNLVTYRPVWPAVSASYCFIALKMFFFFAFTDVTLIKTTYLLPSVANQLQTDIWSTAGKSGGKWGQQEYPFLSKQPPVR